MAVDFRFNMWGSTRVPRERYASTGRGLAPWLESTRVEAPFVLEGGSVTTNGEGTMIAVATSVLNENRNPGVGREEIEAAFAEHLGIKRTIWLDHGLVDDWTGGHADNVAVFVGPNSVLCQTVTDPEDPNASGLAANRATLEAAGLEIIDLPVLPYAFHERRVAIPYLNAFVGNGCVVAPLAGDRHGRRRPSRSPRGLARPRSGRRAGSDTCARRRRGPLHHAAGAPPRGREVSYLKKRSPAMRAPPLTSSACSSETSRSSRSLRALFLLLLILALFFHVHSFRGHMNFLSFAGMMMQVYAFYAVDDYY